MIGMIIGRVNLCSNKQYVSTKQLCIGHQANHSKTSNNMMNLIGLYMDHASMWIRRNSSTETTNWIEDRIYINDF